MRSSIVIAAMFASLAFAAQANDGVELSLKSKAIASSSVAKQAPAPFTAARDPMPQLLMLEEQEQRAAPRASACEVAARDVCYDLAEQRIVYKPARQYMPEIGGMKAESVSLRTNRIVFKYSFK
jgi:hypothetical protein